MFLHSWSGKTILSPVYLINACIHAAAKPVSASVAETDNFHADNPLLQTAQAVYTRAVRILIRKFNPFAYQEVGYAARIAIWIIVRS